MFDNPYRPTTIVFDANRTRSCNGWTAPSATKGLKDTLERPHFASAPATPSRVRAMIIFWISEVPPPIEMSFASRIERSTGYSLM